MAEETRATDGGNDASGQVAFDYIKNPNFRIVRADGAIGGITPNGHVHFALYSERQPIPRRLVYDLPEDGTLGEPIAEETICRDAIVREMEVDIFMSPDVARSLRDWLNMRLGELDQRDNADLTEISS